MVSRFRPSYSTRSTWVNGSSRPPNLLVVRRTPLATARTLPWFGLSSTTTRSASPNGKPRRTMPWSLRKPIPCRLPTTRDSAGNRIDRPGRPTGVTDRRTAAMPRRILFATIALTLGLPMAALAQVTDEPIIEPPLPPCPWWDCGGTAEVVVESYRVDTIIEDGIATTHVTQVLRNDSAFIAQGQFLFPIPADAVVTGLTLWIHGSPVSGEVLEGDTARRTYEDIVRRTLDPALLEFADDGLVRLSVFPMPARATRTVEIEYREVLPADGGLVRYTNPLAREHEGTLQKLN